MLEGFRPFNFNEGAPYASITKNGITFNRSVIIKLGYPEYVRLLINEPDQMIAIQVASEATENAVKFCTPEKRNGKVLSVRWNGRDLLNTLQEMTGWDLSQLGFRVEGQLLPNEGAMMFDLKRFIPLN